ncbi:MAG TPA: hypothetical protein VFW83_04660 [Bryobacteraceae bacterium]|nr:hypothetical protein [Bryobacteraceae bacterium]
MRTVQYKRWCPAASPLRIEIPEDLLRELRPRPDAAEDSGVLYGWRFGMEIRALSRLGKDLEKVGIFASRSRGEVFLTESNLELFERENAAIALVIAGDRAGFFVRELDGSIQTVQSHQEFAVADPPAPRPAPVFIGPPRSRKWTWAAAAILSLGLPMAALAYLRPTAPPPLALHSREEATEVRISWTPGRAGILSIKDGGERIAVPVPPDESNLTYQPRTRELEVTFIGIEANGSRTNQSIAISRHSK